MKNIQKILRSLRKTTLIDLAKKSNVPHSDKSRDELAEELDRYFNDNLERQNFLDSHFFKILFPVVVAIISFLIGRWTDIPNYEVNSSISNLKSENSKNLQKLAYRLPKSLSLNNLSLTLNYHDFDTLYHVDIHNEICDFIDSLDAVSSYYQRQIRLFPSKRYNGNLQSFLEGTSVGINIVMGDATVWQKGFMDHELYWNLMIPLSFKDNTSHIYYHRENSPVDSDYLVYSLNDLSIQESDLKFKNGINSASDLCEKKVWVQICIRGSNSPINPAIKKPSFLSLSDDNNFEYALEFTGEEWELDEYEEYLSEQARIGGDFKFKGDRRPFAVHTYYRAIFKCKSF